MNNNQGKPTQRPAQSRPSNATRPQQSTSGAQRPAGQRPAPQNRPAQTGNRPPMQSPYARPRKKRIANETLVLILMALAVILAALIVTLVIIKNDGKNDGDIAESTGDNSIQAGVDAEDDIARPWRPLVENPKAFIPLSDASTVTVSANDIYSSNIIMVDLSTNKVVCELGADAKIYPASLTKVMTVIVACDLIKDMDETTTIPEDVIESLKAAKASRAYLASDTPYTMQDLLYGAMLPSGADACYGLAKHLAGSEEAFVKLMNQKATEIGCSGTNFVNTTGLHNDNHYSTVRDMATIMAYAMNNPELKKIMAAGEYTPSSKIVGFNYMESLWKGQLGEYKSSKATMYAAKTGMTDEAGHCLASLSKATNGKEYIIISVGAPKGGIGKAKTFADAAHLCDTYIK